MRKTINVGIWGLVLILAVPLVAAPDGEPGPPKGRRAARAGNHGRHVRRRGGRGLDVKRLRAEMETKLKLTADQRTDIRGMLADYEKDVGEARAQRRERFASHRDEMAAIRDKMRAAREAGDEEAAKAAREEMRALFAGVTDDRQLQKELFTAIGEILDDAQQKTFRQIVQDLHQRGGPVRLDRLPPRRLQQAAEAAGIAQEKRDALAQLAGDFEQARKDVDRSDRAGMRRLFMAYHKDLQDYLKSLTPEEHEAMVKAVRERSGRRGDGRGRPHGKRRGRGGKRGQPDRG